MAETHDRKPNKSIRFLWEKGGKFHSIWPVFDAFDTFLFSLNTKTHRAPHVRDSGDLKRVMTLVIYGLIPPTLFGIYNIGYQTSLGHGMDPTFLTCIWIGLLKFVPLFVISYGVGMFWEMFFAVIRKEEVSEGYLVTGLLIPLIVPPTLPWWQLAVAITFAVILGKEVFGGTGMNIVNVALMTRAFLFFAYPAEISGDSVWVYLKNSSPVLDGFSAATPLSLSASAGDMGMSSIQAVHEAGGYSFMQMFLGFIPGSIGETSKLAILLGAVLLLITRVASWRVMVACILGLVGTVGLMNIFAGSSDNLMMQIPIHYHLMMGGFMFGVVYMATDPVSSPELPGAKWIYGILIGVMTALVRVINPAYPEGTMLAILLLNVFAPLIDYVFLQLNIRARRLRHAQ